MAISRIDEIEAAKKEWYKTYKPADEYDEYRTIMTIWLQGVNWADSHPSAETIEKILFLRDKWLEHLMKEHNTYISMSDWIRDHWNDEN